MDFSLNEEQTMLADSVSRFIAGDYQFERRQKIVASDEGFSREVWQTFTELGWTALPFAAADGGLDGGPIELMLMMEQFGRGLVVEPYLANIVLSGGILQRAANKIQKETWLAPIIDGKLQAAFAFAEPQNRYDFDKVATSARRDGNNYVLNGKKSFVLNAAAANVLLVPARCIDGQADATGISLFVVPSDSPGLATNSYVTVDGLRAAEITLTDVNCDSANLLDAANGVGEIIHEVMDNAILAISAEAVGIMQALHDKTVEYAKNRVQFGVPIGSFQALQHRMVDTLMLCEETRSLLLWCVLLGSASDPQFRCAVSALKYKVGIAGTKVAQEAVQLHGGMGVTWELDIAHYFKRISAINIMLGNADHHLDRYVALSDAATVNA